MINSFYEYDDRKHLLRVNLKMELNFRNVTVNITLEVHRTSLTGEVLGFCYPS